MSDARSSRSDGENSRLLPSDLRDALVAPAAAFFGFDGEPVIADVRLLQNPYSKVFRVTLGWREALRSIYVKVPPRTPRNEHILSARLSTEYRILSDLFAQFGPDRRIGVVQPYGYFPKALALATVDAGSVTLRHAIASHGRRVAWPGQRRQLLDHARSCGLWLKEFHESTSRGHAAFDQRDLLEYCKGRTELLAANPAVDLDSSWASSMMTRLEHLADSVPLAANRVAGRHNDFASHNVIASVNRVRVLDFSMFDYGSVAFDACNFWFDLEMLKADPTYSGDLLLRMQQAFLEAYGSVMPEDPTFVAARCRYALNRLLTALDAPVAGRFRSIGHRRIAAQCQGWLRRFAQAEIFP